jgi:flagellar biosynthesis/type III secretory pathway protein FliH
MKYYSEKLDKIFDTQEALKEAEEKHEAEQAKKAEAKALVAKESADVQDAFKARNAARKAYNKSLIEARKVYNEALQKARDEFEASLDESTKALKEAEEDYDTKLKAFQKAHPEGYHLTLKDGDNVVTYTGNLIDEHSKALTKEFDEINNLFSEFFRRFYW